VLYPASETDMDWAFVQHISPSFFKLTFATAFPITYDWDTRSRNVQSLYIFQQNKLRTGRQIWPSFSSIPNFQFLNNEVQIWNFRINTRYNSRLECLPSLYMWFINYMCLAGSLHILVGRLFWKENSQTSKVKVHIYLPQSVRHVIHASWLQH